MNTKSLPPSFTPAAPTALLTAAHGTTTTSKAMQAVIDQLADLGGKPIDLLTPKEARKQPTPADAVRVLLQQSGQSTAPEVVAKVVNKSIPGPGGEIRIRIYTPLGTGPFPVVLYIHGGAGSSLISTCMISSPRALANAAGAVVVSTHYRLAPEHPFPAFPRSVEKQIPAISWPTPQCIWPPCVICCSSRPCCVRGS